MKFTKRILAALLTLALALTLALPAAAITRDAITLTGPDQPVPYGESFTLSVSVDLPDGVEVESYQWGWQKQIDGATGPSLTVTPDDEFYPEADKPYSSARRRYWCRITFVEKDTDGNVIDTVMIAGNDIDVTVAPERGIRFGELLKESCTSGFAFILASSVLSGYILVPFFPITFLIGFFLRFFHAI